MQPGFSLPPIITLVLFAHYRSSNPETLVHRASDASIMRYFALLATVYAATFGTSHGETNSCVGVLMPDTRIGVDIHGQTIYGLRDSPELWKCPNLSQSHCSHCFFKIGEYNPRSLHAIFTRCVYRSGGLVHILKIYCSLIKKLVLQFPYRCIRPLKRQLRD